MHIKNIYLNKGQDLNHSLFVVERLRTFLLALRLHLIQPLRQYIGNLNKSQTNIFCIVITRSHVRQIAVVSSILKIQGQN